MFDTQTAHVPTDEPMADISDTGSIPIDPEKTTPSTVDQDALTTSSPLESTTSPTMTDTPSEAKKKPSATWYSLPKELKDDILDRVLHATTVQVRRGEVYNVYDVRIETNTIMSRLPALPDEVASLKLACRDFAQCIGDKWHPKVTYRFPTTVSLVDILSQWSDEQIRSVRYIRVCDTPLNVRVFGYNGYMGKSLRSVIAMFPGLQLHTLSIENMKLLPSGEGTMPDYVFTYLDIVPCFLSSKGWKNLEYISGILPFLPSQQAFIENRVEKHSEEMDEADFDVKILGRMRPQMCDLLLDWDPSSFVDRATEMKKWYAEHPDEGQPDDFPRETSKKVTVMMRRGDKAQYMGDGQGLGALFAGFRTWDQDMTWEQMRQMNDYIIDGKPLPSIGPVRGGQGET